MKRREGWASDSPDALLAHLHLSAQDGVFVVLAGEGGPVAASRVLHSLRLLGLLFFLCNRSRWRRFSAHGLAVFTHATEIHHLLVAAEANRAVLTHLVSQHLLLAGVLAALLEDTFATETERRGGADFGGWQRTVDQFDTGDHAARLRGDGARKARRLPDLLLAVGRGSTASGDVSITASHGGAPETRVVTEDPVNRQSSARRSSLRDFGVTEAVFLKVRWNLSNDQ